MAGAKLVCREYSVISFNTMKDTPAHSTLAEGCSPRMEWLGSAIWDVRAAARSSVIP